MLGPNWRKDRRERKVVFWVAVDAGVAGAGDAATEGDAEEE